MFGGLYFTVSKMSHQFFFEFFGLLYLLDIMINISFMSVLHLVCHLDLNSQSSHAFPALALTVNFISKFWRSSKFWDTFLLILLQSLKLWVNVLSLLISFITLFFTSILFSSVCPWSTCLLMLGSWIFYYVFGLCFHNKYGS